MGDLGDLANATYDYLFRFSSWGKFRKASFIATLIYAASLYGFVAVNQIRDRELNEELKQKGIIVKSISDNDGQNISVLEVLQNGNEIYSTPFGNNRGSIINSFGNEMTERLGLQYKIARILIEDNPERLSKYYTQGYNKFTASYFVVSSVIGLSLVHPIGLALAPGAIYINWDGEVELYSARKILDLEKKGVVFKRQEPNWMYTNVGFMLYIVSILGGITYACRKIKKLAGIPAKEQLSREIENESAILQIKK